MRPLLKSPLPVFLIWFSGWIALFVLGSILSKGWQYPDASPYRNFLYLLMFVILPATACLGIIHCIACIITLKIARQSAIAAFFIGFIGVAILHYSIQTSPDPWADMGYIAAVAIYCIFAVAGFLVSCITLFAISKVKRRTVQ